MKKKNVNQDDWNGYENRRDFIDKYLMTTPGIIIGLLIVSVLCYFLP